MTTKKTREYRVWASNGVAYIKAKSHNEAMKKARKAKHIFQIYSVELRT
jgi:hypothetical protein